MRQAHTNKPMITNYPTCRTAKIRTLRHHTLSTLGASNHLLSLGMILRVDMLGSLRLLNNWLFGNDESKALVVDDSPYAGGFGIAALVFDNGQAIGERSRSWSQRFRRKKGVLRP
jgi:hypothetical protein